jgi:hypothetical protein
VNYSELLKKIDEYKKIYSVKEIGSSFFGRKIFAVERLENPSFPTAIFLCSVHARENITTDLVCKMIDEHLFDNISKFNLSFILMTNPDGVELCTGGLETAPPTERENLLNINGNSSDFSLWKANGRGVDINNNFDANFGTNVGSVVPAPSGFVGANAESEPETKAIVEYTKKIMPFLTISYHSKGEEIYFNFFQSGKELEMDNLIAKRFANSTGYVIKNPEKTSSGGYKDFCVQKLKIPALTIEVGSDYLSHPIGKEHLNEIFECHKNVATDLEFAYNVFREYRYGI